MDLSKTRLFECLPTDIKIVVSVISPMQPATNAELQTTTTAAAAAASEWTDSETLPGATMLGLQHHHAEPRSGHYPGSPFKSHRPYNRGIGNQKNYGRPNDPRSERSRFRPFRRRQLRRTCRYPDRERTVWL